jgi:transposase
LELHNDNPKKGREYSRRSQYNDIEKDALRPLPKLKYELKQQHMATVPKNNYVCLTPDKHYYSVPYQFIGKRVKIIFTKTQVDIYYDYNLIASHKRTKSPYNHTTITDHLASTHRFVNDWNPERFISWGESIGPETKLMIINILKKKQHPEQAYKSCLGVLGMAKKVGNERLNNACKRAMAYNTYNYMAIQNILSKGLDKLEDETTSDLFNMPKHDNIRGEDYYE